MLNQKSANVLSISKLQMLKTVSTISNNSVINRKQTDKIHTRPSGINKMIGSMLLM